MKKFSVTFLVLAAGYLIVSGAAAWAAAPTVVLKDAEPGLVVSFDSTNQPGDWGKLDWSTDPTTYVVEDGAWRNIVTTDNAALRYKTTLKFDPTVTAMPVNKDWAAKFVWKHEGVTFSAGYLLIELMALDGTVTKDIAKIIYEDGTNFSIMAGDGTGSYARIPVLTKENPWDGDVFTMMPNTYHTIVFHYKSSNQRMDLWVDDVLVAEDFQARQGAYGIYWIQLRGGVQESIDYFDEVAIGSASDPSNPQDCTEAKLFGYGLLADLNGDCYINISDFAEMAKDWLKCVNPVDVNCERPWENVN